MLDQELRLLPEHYRSVIVLCDLEGKTTREAAGQLGCPPATAATRLRRGRELLARRLERHGVVMSGGLLAAALAREAVASTAPPLLLRSTIQAAATTAGQAVTGVISARVAALTDGVLKTMFLTRLKIVTAVALLTALLGGAAWGIATGQAPEAKRAEKDNSSTSGAVLNPQEVAKRLPKDKVTVQFTVRSVAIPLGPFVPGGARSDRIDKRSFDLKGDHRFVAHVAGKAAVYVYRLGLDPEAYFSGKVIRVSGQVESHRNRDDGKTDLVIRVEGLDHLEVVKPADNSAAIRLERRKLAGDWRLVGIEMEGRKASKREVEQVARVKAVALADERGARRPTGDVGGFIVHYDARGTWTHQTGTGTLLGQGTSKMDPASKPKSIDQTGTVVGRKDEETRLGIYEFTDDDTLRICLAAPGKARPTDFTTQRGDGRILWTLQRIKKSE